MGENTDTWRGFWHGYAEAFGYPLRADSTLGWFVANPSVTGAYAEAWLRCTVRSMLPQYRVSTGAILKSLDKSRDLRKIPQCDLIIWDPSELPALFEQGEFALVPWFSVRAVLEVKRTCSAISKLERQLRKVQDRVPDWHNVLGVVIRHSSPLFDVEVCENWQEKRRSIDRPAMTRLLDNKGQVDTDGLFAFLYFVSQIAGHGRRLATAHAAVQSE